MLFLPDDLIKLLLALLLGALIGIEREFRDKTAGFRTVIFICLGAALFTAISISFNPTSDPARIAAQVVTGVGFLGAGAILRDSGRIVGLTTASIIWLAAAIGMGVGAGRYLLATTATGLVLLVLLLFSKVEGWINVKREGRTYEIICQTSGKALTEVERMFSESGLRVAANHRKKRGDEIISTWIVQGSIQAHRKLVDQLLASQDVQEFTF